MICGNKVINYFHQDVVLGVLPAVEVPALGVVLVCESTLESWLTIAGLLMTAERRDTDIGAVVGEGLPDCE